MSKHDDAVSLRDMLDHAREAVQMAREWRAESVAQQRVLSLATLYLMQTIGEAASRVSAVTQERFPEIPWRQVVGMRHRLVHGYDAVDYALVRSTIEEDLPFLIRQLEEALARSAQQR